MLVSFTSLKSQNLDFGIQGGGTFYIGELNRTIFKDISYSLGGFVRLNINPYWSVRANYQFMDIKMKGYTAETVTEVALNKAVHDISAQADFNFFKFSENGMENRITPYLTLGVGCMLYEDINNDVKAKAIIPFGVGGKFCITKGLVIGAEWSWRKTFYADDLDNVEVKLGNGGTTSLYSDWYSYFGVNISYGFDVLTKKTCRTVWDGSKSTKKRRWN